MHVAQPNMSCGWFSNDLHYFFIMSIPNHIGFIMDGNRRWAKRRGELASFGHRAGYERFKEVGEWCLKKGIKEVSFFGFSLENWQRAEDEISCIFSLLERAFTQELPFFIERGIRIRVLGQRDRLPPSTQRAIDEAQRATAHHTALQFIVCFNYGGRSEIVDAAKTLIRQGVSPESLTEDRFAAALYDPDISYPDLIVRTSGEQRLSGFLLWQSAYSELYFTPLLWPDFDEAALDEALIWYQGRERRFGK